MPPLHTSQRRERGHMVRTEEHLKVTEIRELAGNGSVSKQLHIVRRRTTSVTVRRTFAAKRCEPEAAPLDRRIQTRPDHSLSVICLTGIHVSEC